MQSMFSDAEQTFVRSGGNLWYVASVLNDGWNVIRWSYLQGHRVIFPAIASQEKAERCLWDFVRPSSTRARTGIHHRIARPDCNRKTFFPEMRQA